MNENPNQKKSRYFLASLLLHLSLFLFILASSIIFPQKLEIQLPTVQVDMVALPSQVKDDSSKFVDTTLPVKENPPPKEEPPPKEPEPKEPEPVALPPKKQPEKKAELATKKEMEKRAKSAIERVQEELKKEREAAERKKLEAMEKRKADLKKFEEKYRAAIRGNQLNQGTSTSGTMQSTMNAYFAHITERLREHWALPSWLQSQSLNAVVRIYLDSRGGVIRMAFIKSSGNEAFDNYVKGAVQQSTPFAPPPEEMAGGLRNSGIEVGFPL